MPTPARCPWLDIAKPLYVRYHDEEWGVPVHDDRQMFEHLALESAQAGLSWYTVLSKRENYRRAFAGFEPERIAGFDGADVDRLLADAGIIRNRAKIEAVIGNARAYLELQAREGSFARFLWGFVDGAPLIEERRVLRDYPVTTPVSDALAKELKRRGFRFVGSTSCYAHMQATGMVNDHVLDCFRRTEIISACGHRDVPTSAGPGCGAR
jgi:DNA-3-methyladenine glycosylase I